MPHLILNYPSTLPKTCWAHDHRGIYLTSIQRDGGPLFCKLKAHGPLLQISLLTTSIDLILNRHKRALQNFAHELEGEIIKSNLGKFLKEEKGLTYLWDEEKLFSFNWHDPRPKILEIGSGNGSLLNTLAMESPQNLYLGTEINGFILKKALRAAENLSLSNVFYLKKDAIYLLDLLIPGSSLDAIHIHFPDPWLKRRHHKRRLINIRTLPFFAKALKTGGTLHFTTDDPSYATEVRRLFSASPLFSLRERHATTTSRIHTKYEKKWIAEGKIIHAFMFQRTPIPLSLDPPERPMQSFTIPAKTRPESGMLLRENSFTVVFQDVYRGWESDIIDAVIRHRGHTWFVLFTWEGGILNFPRELNPRFLTSGVKRHLETLLHVS